MVAWQVGLPRLAFTHQQVADGMRATMFLTVMELEEYRIRTGDFPRTLEEAGFDRPDLTFRAHRRGASSWKGAPIPVRSSTQRRGSLPLRTVLDLVLVAFGRRMMEALHSTPARNRRNGFTLVEVLTVVIVIGDPLRGWRSPIYRDVTVRADAARVIADVHTIQLAVADFLVDEKVHPFTAAIGVVPPQLEERLPDGFPFAWGAVRYRLPSLGHSRDRHLGAAEGERTACRGGGGLLLRPPAC